MGSVRYYQQPIVTTKDVYVVKPVGDLLPRYLYFLIKQRELVLKQEARGTIQLKHVTMGTLEEFRVGGEIPPLSVQEKLVRCYELHLYFIALLSKQQEHVRQSMKYLVDRV